MNTITPASPTPTIGLSEKFIAVRDYTAMLCQPLQTEDYGSQPAPFASPPKWHLAHTTWFFEEFILKPHKKGYKVYHEDFSYLFNSYYNNVGARVLRVNRGIMTRPVVTEVYAYRKHVNKHMVELLADEPTHELAELVILGMHHEQQHQELLITDLKYTFAHNPVFPVYKKNFDLLSQKNENQDSGFVEIEEGIYEIGFQGAGFCYDNELGRHKVYLHNTEISKSLVTCGEYLDFMESGGYKDFNLWLDEGWAWVNETEAKAPLYWHHVNGEWHHYTLGGLQKVTPQSILAHVNFYEAAAFAEWKGMRLPTEFEWEVASQQFNWGKRWEWTHSAYLPYPKFKKAPGAIGEYNGKFMVNQMVLRGASTATSPDHSRNTYRNFFHAREQWQFTGIRLAK